MTRSDSLANANITRSAGAARRVLNDQAALRIALVYRRRTEAC